MEIPGINYTININGRGIHTCNWGTYEQALAKFEELRQKYEGQGMKIIESSRNLTFVASDNSTVLLVEVVRG